MTFKICSKVALASALLAAAAPGTAATTYYFSEATFTAATGALAGFEGFNDARSAQASHDYGPFTIEEIDGINALVTTAVNSFFTAATVEGTGSIWFDDNGESKAVFTFDAPITAFGLYVTSNGRGTVQVLGDFGADGLFLSPNEPAFFGLVADSGFTTVTLFIEGDPELGFDALRFGDAGGTPVIPEPATWAMLIAGFGLVGMAARRRRALA